MSRFLFVSEGWIDAYAPGRSAEELMGKTDFDVFSSQHAAAAFADEQRIIRTGEPIAGLVERETYSGRAGRLGVHHQDAAAGHPWPDHRHVRHLPRRDRADQGGARAGPAGQGAERAERAAARAGPAEGRVHRAGLARAAHPADLDHRLHRAAARRAVQGAERGSLRRGDRAQRAAAAAPGRRPAVPVPDPVRAAGHGTARHRPGRHRGRDRGGDAARSPAQEHQPGPVQRRRAHVRRRPDPDRPAARQPHLQRGEVHPGGRPDRRQRAHRRRPRGARGDRHRHRHPRPPTRSGSSSGSSGRRRPPGR